MSDRLHLENITYQLGGRTLLAGLNLSVADGELLLISGRSGSGKSTLLEICAGLLAPQVGAVSWRGRLVHQLSAVEMDEQRHRTGVMFQRHALLSNFTIFENIALPLRYHLGLSDQQVHERVWAVLERFGLTEIARMLPEQVALGQARLASFGRALIMQPDLLLLDEPTSGLDEDLSRMLFDQLAALRQSGCVTVVMFSHAVAPAYAVGDLRCAVLDKGVLAMGE